MSGASSPTVIAALARGDLTLLRALLSGRTRGAALTALLDARLEAENHYTLLTYAAWLGQADAVRLLLESGASVGSTTGSGRSALHIACYEGQLEMVALLRDAGAAIDQCCDNGETPLHAACEGRLEIARLLFDARADVNLAGDNGDTPLHLACLGGDPDIVRLLLSAGAMINQANEGGCTPLYVACQEGRLAIARGRGRRLGIARPPRRSTMPPSGARACHALGWR